MSIVIELPRTMTSQAWEQMVDILGALKQGWVSDAEKPRQVQDNIRRDDPEAAARGISDEAREIVEKA